MQPTAQHTRGTAALQGKLWSADPEGWALQEELQAPIYEAVADRAGVGPRTDVLDVGCGSGVFLGTAAVRGATVAGLDAAEGLVALARKRVPDADVRVGDSQALPFEDGSFDVVTGFNSFQFAEDVVAALSEARRVTRPGGRVAIQVWGRPDRCDLLAVIGAASPLMPGPPPSPPGGGNYSDPGVLERIAGEAGLTPEVADDVVCAFEYPDDETFLRGTLAAGMMELAARTSGREALRTAILEAIAPFRGPDGRIRFVNEWHYLVARA